jgi:hypothetical protein
MGIVDRSDLDDVSADNFEALKALNDSEKLSGGPAARLRGTRSYYLCISCTGSKQRFLMCV